MFLRIRIRRIVNLTEGKHSVLQNNSLYLKYTETCHLLQSQNLINIKILAQNYPDKSKRINEI